MTYGTEMVQVTPVESSS